MVSMSLQSLSYRSTVLSLMTLLSLASVAGAAGPPQWIWPLENRTPGTQSCIFTRFELNDTPQQVRLWGLADYCHAAFYINGNRVQSSEPFDGMFSIELADHLRTGPNTIGVCCRSGEGPAAVFLELFLSFDAGNTREIATDHSWRFVALPGDQLDWPTNDRIAGNPVTALSPVDRFPWGDGSDSVTVQSPDDYTQWERAQGTRQATDPSTFLVPEGFEIELLRTARESEDSWVTMAFDPSGRIVVAQEEQGLLRFTLSDEAGDELKVERINTELHECRGLLFANNSLYAMANNDKGLYQLRDTNNDDNFDEVKLLKKIDGDVGHGRNQMVLGPDGKIYAIFGDAVYEPADAASLPPTISCPTDAERTRSGYLACMDLDGRNWQVVTRGLRNPFGIAFNADGEPFTYDADAEYDMGAPWYRPTRVDHLVAGGDFGWRRVTQQWPPYVPDRADIPRPTLDIGKGSPTAVTFGSGSQFPLRYREALYVLDWAYGRILAVHLSPWGGSYAGKAEVFVRGRPANVTDIEFGPDGAMYFVTGGRGTQSALYRVRYLGPSGPPAAPTIQQQARRNHAETARRLRRQLESLLGHPPSADVVSRVWPHLGSDDPWIRHAARAALEWQPIDLWQSHTLGEDRPAVALEALLALSRVGPPQVQSVIVERLNALALEKFNERQLFTALFIYQRCLADSQPAAVSPDVVGVLDSLYPHTSAAANRLLSLMLSRFQPDQFIERTIQLLDDADDQHQRMHYLFSLRNIDRGWRAKTRKVYFDRLREFDQFVGGSGMPKFQQLIVEEALATLAKPEREQFEEQLHEDVAFWFEQIPQEDRPLVQRWTMTDFDLLPSLAGRDLERGKKMFAVGRCVACHRVGASGAPVGPDLSAISARFTPRDVLRAVLEPSRVVAEKYRSETFVLNDGRTVSGRVMPGDYRAATLRVAIDPLDPSKLVEFPKAIVELHQLSPVSPMPEGLVDTLTKDEILDLLAYLQAGE